MSSHSSQTSRVPLVRLLDVAFDEFSDELMRRAYAAGYTDVRPGHGCVFGTIDPEGSRLTDLAERACMTKQTVGEVASDLEKLGYVERVPDPSDGRAKIIRLTERGREAQTIGRDLIDDIERDWGERFGAERVAVLRSLLEDIEAARTPPPAATRARLLAAGR
jgi:DNA-binding MarR family transcriptional regulator